MLFARTLRQHFLKQTVVKNITLTESALLQKKENQSNSIDAREAYQQFIYTEDPCDLDGKELPPVFDRFCNDGEQWMQTADERKVKRAESVFEDYIIMRRAAREESHILALNKVGIERDEKKLRENVARHVGLQMPQEFKD